MKNNKTEECDHQEEVASGPMCDVRTRTIFLTGPINENTAHQVVSSLNTLEFISPKAPIRIVLNSHGGMVDSGYAIYDAIRLCRCVVVIDVIGSAFSIAALILQAGDIRRMSENSEAMIHNGTLYTGTEGIQSNDIPKINARNLSENQKYQKAIAKRSGQPFGKIKNWCDQETFFTAQESLKLNFIDSIIKPQNKRIGWKK